MMNVLLAIFLTETVHAESELRQLDTLPQRLGKIIRQAGMQELKNFENKEGVEKLTQYVDETLEKKKINELEKKLEAHIDEKIEATTTAPSKKAIAQEVKKKVHEDIARKIEGSESNVSKESKKKVIANKISDYVIDTMQENQEKIDEGLPATIPSERDIAKEEAREVIVGAMKDPENNTPIEKKGMDLAIDFASTVVDIVEDHREKIAAGSPETPEEMTEKIVSQLTEKIYNVNGDNSAVDKETVRATVTQVVDATMAAQGSEGGGSGARALQGLDWVSIFQNSIPLIEPAANLLRKVLPQQLGDTVAAAAPIAAQAAFVALPLVPVALEAVDAAQRVVAGVSAR